MATASSSATIYGHGEGEPPDQKTRLNSSSDSHPPAAVPQKRKRNQPGRPNPDAEVIALSPKSLMAMNRFICEVCNKGFQRDQNLRLHRRGHNLPWSLRQKGTGEVVKPRVYLCPEPTCVHHDPSRALGDLTGIKKHYFRKHGEKKWKCDKCSKRYAVLSDLKAHSKTCGTREYRCGCGTVFSRRDSFITHRAFCDALAQENAHLTANMNAIKSELYGSNHSVNLGLSQRSSAGDIFRFGGGLVPPEEPSSSSSHFRGFQFPHSILPDKSFPGMLQFQEPQYITATASSSSSSAAASSTSSIFNLNFYHSKIQTEHPGSPYKPVQHSDFLLPQISEHGFFHGAACVNQMESMYPSANAQDAHLRDLMDSLANGNVGVDLAGCSGEPLSFKRVCSREDGGLVREEEHKLQQRLKMEDISGAAGFTRDFLGIGSMVRTMISERDQNGGIDFVPFDSELTSSSSARPFPGRGWP